jgi:hypothetical protein
MIAAFGELRTPAEGALPNTWAAHTTLPGGMISAGNI